MAAKLFEGLPTLDPAAIPGLVETLRAIHGGRAPIADAPQAAPSAAETPLYGAIRAGVEWMEREARRHSEFVDRLTGVVAPTTKAAYQQTLYMQGACGSRTAGRFRCLNRRVGRVEVCARLRPFSMNGAPAPVSPALTLRPGGFLLGPNEARMVVVEADLSACSEPGKYESSVDILMNDAVTLKLWIEIDVYD